MLSFETVTSHVLIFLFRYLDDVALHHLVDALCRLSTTSMEQAQSNKVINLPSPEGSLLRAVCAFRVTWSEQVFSGQLSRIRHRGTLTEKAWEYL